MLLQARISTTALLAAVAIQAAACGGDGTNSQMPFDARPSVDSGGLDMDASTPPGDPTDPANFDAPQGETLAFGVKDGDLRNYFYRQGTVAVHLLTRSGQDPRVVVAYPAGNSGIGVWFQSVDAPVELRIGDDASIGTGGGLAGVVKKGSQMRGVRATLQSDAASLTVATAILANIRTLRDYEFDVQPDPVMKHQSSMAGEVAVLERTTIGGEHHMALYLKPLDGTKIELTGETFEIAAGEQGIKLELVALADDEVLTPIDKANLVTEDAAMSEKDLNTLAFLTYGEKLLAGSWRFLTYFGRDTLLSIRMLMPVLKPEVVEAALSSVIERVNLDPNLVDSNFDYTVELGDVAHEEEIGDFAAWKNSMLPTPPADLRTPLHDYKMIDDDFLLAPVLAEYAARYPDRLSAFLARTRTLDNATYASAIEKNLDLVLTRATPYAGEQIATNLVKLRTGVPVGEWRDSDQGLGFGRIAFNVNAALVPAALEAAQTLYAQLGLADKVIEAIGLRDGWAGVDAHFLVAVASVTARERVQAYAQSVQLDTDAANEIPADGEVQYHAISLTEAGEPVPVMHSDHGFVMLFTDPSEAYLKIVADSIARTFPAGLLSPVGMMVANPALSGQTSVEQNFTKSNYHGTVVWSWQQAMMAAGIERQLAREDLAADTKALLQNAQCKLWQSIESANEQRQGELWTWVPNADGVPEYRPFGYDRADQDESNAAQLWSTVYLAVQRPETLPTECTPAPARR